MAEAMDTSETEAKAVYVIACEDDRTALESLGLETLLQKNGFKIVWYEVDPKERVPAVLEKMGPYKNIIFTVSEKSLRDSWLEHCRRTVVSDKFLVHLVISKDINIAAESSAMQGEPMCMTGEDIAALPIEIRVFPCFTVRDQGWSEKLIRQLGKKMTGGCSAVGKIAPGLCCSYVHGYLEMVLDEYKDHIEDWQKVHRIGADGKMVMKMINLIPKSCGCNKDIEKYDEANITYLQEKVLCRKTYLDTQDRKFDMPVYRVQNPLGESEVYYAVLIQNATVHTLYEMAQDSTLDHDTMIRERSLFETQLIDMMQNRPIEIISFDDRKANDTPAYLTNLIIEKCQQITQEV